jgi:hypothetical protein
VCGSLEAESLAGIISVRKHLTGDHRKITYCDYAPWDSGNVYYFDYTIGKSSYYAGVRYREDKNNYCLEILREHEAERR